MVNDVTSQHILLDRRAVYKVLKRSGVPVPPHIIVNRNGPDWNDPPGFVEEEDFVEIEGKRRITKPFVEKPVSGEDHNVNIYYPGTVGGGVKKLFRKIGNRSSEFFPGGTEPGISSVRRKGSFIYEAFLATGGVDVKVYTVGQHYAHAEARKSPVVDGRVMRDPSGKEVRFPVLLSTVEKEIARKVSIAFGQNVCGFDLLRCKGKSYVCDVNGWSFVKNSKKYYADTAASLRNIILSALDPLRLGMGLGSINPVREMMALRLSSPGGIPSLDAGAVVPDASHPGSVKRSNSFSSESVLLRMIASEENASASAASPVSRTHAAGSGADDDTTAGVCDGNGELRCVLCVVRHGDRTPKQKLKVRVGTDQQPLLDLLRQHGSGKRRSKLEAKLKSPQQLQELLDAIRRILSDEEGEKALSMANDDFLSDGNEFEARVKTLRQLERVREVLEQGGHFSGIYRKAQIKPTRWKRVDSDAAAAVTSMSASSSSSSLETGFKAGASSRETVYDKKSDSETVPSGETYVVTEAQLVMKWGGVLTHRGREQAEVFGRRFRQTMYPSLNVDAGGSAGEGLLRLHSTYRHDLKIYSSDEGRVQMSAAAYAKGLLDLDGDLTPILISLVKKDASMLDAYGKGASEDIMAAKKKLYTLMTTSPARDEAGVLRGKTGSLRACVEEMWLMDGTNDVHAMKAAMTTGAAAAGGGGGGGAGGGGLSTSVSESSSAPPPRCESPAKGGATLGELEAAPAAALPPVAPLTSLGSGSMRNSLSPAASPVPPFRSGSHVEICPPPTTVKREVLHSLPEWERPGTIPDDLIPPAPLDDLAHLVRKMHTVTKQLRERSERREKACLRAGREPAAVPEAENKLRPHGGESIHLMHERWKKLEEELYKRGSYDISKVPDIYDTIKYDVIHNRHLSIAGMEEAYLVAKGLADVVIPSEYGLGAEEKLRIASRICAPLLGKVLHDLDCAASEEIPKPDSSRLKRSSSVDGMHKDKIRHIRAPAPSSVDPGADAINAAAAAAAAAAVASLDDGAGDDDNHGGGDGEHDDDEDDEEEVQHRLDAEYAMDVNTPERHVRSRVYFTSESHLHALLNVLRFCHLSAKSGDAEPRLCSPAASKSIHELPELDYLSHIIIRLYEDNTGGTTRSGLDDEERFRIDIQVSCGTDDETAFVDGDVASGLAHENFSTTTDESGDIVQDAEARRPSMTVTSPLISLSDGQTVTLSDVRNLLSPFAVKWNTAAMSARSKHGSGVGASLFTSGM